MKSRRSQEVTAISPRGVHVRAFTLIELLIVVVILGIMAAMVIPKFSNATQETKENMLRENLRMLKAQVGAYRAEHWDISPGYPNGDASVAPTAAAFVAQLTQYTDRDGVSNAQKTDRFKYGPYLRQMPKNPINGIDTVEMVDVGAALPASADDSDGWIFRPDDLMTLRADAAGSDSKGQSYYDY